MKTKKLRARIVTIALVFAMVLSIAPTMAFAKTDYTGRLSYRFSLDGISDGEDITDCSFTSIALNGESVGSGTSYEDTKNAEAGITVSAFIDTYDFVNFAVKIVDTEGAELASGNKNASYTLKGDATITVSASADSKEMTITVDEEETEPTIDEEETEPTVNPVKDGKMAFDFDVEYYTADEYYFDDITLNGEYLDSDMFETETHTWEKIPAGTTVSINVSGKSSDAPFTVEILDEDNNYAVLNEGTNKAEFTLPYDADVLVSATVGTRKVTVLITKVADATPTDDNDDNATTSSANDENTTTVADKDNATTAIADTTAQAKTDAAKTADNNNLAMWIVLICVAGGCVVGATIRKRSANR